MASDNRELKKLSLEFRNLASSVVRSDESYARTSIRRLLTFVAQTPLLANRVAQAPRPMADVAVLWEETRKGRERLPLPDDSLEELGLLQAVLEMLGQGLGESFRHDTFLYGGKTNLRECAQEVLHDVAGRYTTHLRQVLEMALLDSGDPAYGSRKIDVHVSGGNAQVNVAQDAATIHAQQAVHQEAAEAIRVALALAEAAKNAASTVPTDVREEAEEVAAVVVEEARRSKPRRITLQAAVGRLKLLAAAGVAGQEISASARALWPHVERLLQAAQQAIGS